jgi:hypothetical protein
MAVLRSTVSRAAMTSCEWRPKGWGSRLEAVHVNLDGEGPGAGPFGAAGSTVWAGSLVEEDRCLPALPAPPPRGADADRDKGAGAAALGTAAMAVAVAFSLAPALASSEEKEMALPGTCCGCGWPFDAPAPATAAAEDGVVAGFLE